MSDSQQAGTQSPSKSAGRRRKPWRRELGLVPVLDRWRNSTKVAPNLVLDTSVAPVPGRYAPIPSTLNAGVHRALRLRGIESLYTHQAAAYECAIAGGDFVSATPTASGKSLCYNLPVLDTFAVEPDARALYIFPTKALSRDQEQGLRALMTDSGIEHGAVTYDGDTPGDARRAARERAGVLLTNPDMLHAGILPHHANWARFFSNLKYVVIDELHMYRGVFGSHLSNVLRRLDRIARFHGSKPVFMFASATIGNPEEHASRMLGRPVPCVGENGAPNGERHVLVYNPPIVNQELGIRQSYVKAAVRLTADLVKAQVTTLVFGQSRTNVEVMLKYLRDNLASESLPPDSIVSYRGGYLPEMRRRIERGLRDGTVRCVVATNALELGIDIGSLDAVVCAGYPGSIAALWQRFGRGGRRGDASLAMLVTSSAPVDQFFALRPEALIDSAVEQARIDPDNVEILVQHLKCASFELPFEDGEAFGDVPGDAVRDALEFLVDSRILHAGQGEGGKTVYHWANDSYPASHVSLRSIGWDNFVIIAMREGDVVPEGGSDSTKLDGQTIAEMDWRSAHTMLHEQAIYQHAAEQYQVECLDFDNRKAFVRKVAPDYYTTAMTHTAVTVIEEDEGDTLGRCVTGLGEVSIIEKVVGFKKIKYHTHENVGYGEVRLPEMQMHTTAAWFTFPNDVVEQLDAPRAVVVDAMRGLANAMHIVGSVLLMVDPRDLGHTVGDGNDTDAPPRKVPGGPSPEFDPTIFLFDHIPGGVGLAPRLFDGRRELFERALGLIGQCPCDNGCPACIGPRTGGAAARDAAGMAAVTGDALAKQAAEELVANSDTPHEWDYRTLISQLCTRAGVMA